MLISSQNTISTGQESVWIVYNSQGQLLVEITGRRGGEAHRHKLNLTRCNPGHQQKQPDHCHEWGKVPHGEVANKIQNDHFNKISSSWQLHLQINLIISFHFWPFLVTVWKKNLPKKSHMSGWGRNRISNLESKIKSTESNHVLPALGCNK